MVDQLVHAPLTKIGFRRDVRLFLTGLVGFLAVLILLLLALLLTNSVQTQSAVRKNWDVVADIGSDLLGKRTQNPADIENVFLMLRARYSLAGLELRRKQNPIVFGATGKEYDEVRRTRGTSTYVFRFDKSDLDAIQSRLLWTTLICAAAVVGGGTLLLLYIPKITRPIEEMLDQARELGPADRGADETAYLIETFRNSIATLRLQETELKRLHEMEKTRADDLERITATLTRSLSSGFLAADDSGRIVDVNGAGREILHLDPAASLAGQDITAVLGQSEFARTLSEAVAQRASLTRKEISEGSENDVIGLTTVPLLTERGVSLGMIALFTDLTPVRTLEARLRDLQTLAELGEMSAGIAHEFRNSLSTILGYLKLARRGELPAEADGRLRNAEEEAVLLSKAIDGLLNFARPMTIEKQPINVTELAASIARRVCGTLEGIEIVNEGDNIVIEGDAALMSRALENVILNAVDSIREKGPNGRIELRSRLEPRPTLEIRDNGMGVDPSQIARLFLPFQTGKPSGMGLGLPLARKIVLLHGGTMRMTGSPGAGAVVTMEFEAGVILSS
jgi:signal transduction histidine kinase